MEIALEEAALAVGHDDVPVGAVVLIDGQVIARRHNERERQGDPTAHAEILALRDAAAAMRASSSVAAPSSRTSRRATVQVGK